MRQLGALSALDLLISATTFSSLGVVLPQMVADLDWSWSAAGLGFTILGASCGGSSLLPPLLIRRLGVRTALMIGAVCMATGLYTLHGVTSLIQYFVGAAFCGVSFQMLAGIPATFVLTRVFKSRSAALGIYWTIGGLGNVVGPWMVLGVLSLPDHTWRDYWQYQALLLLVSGVACAFIVGLDRRFARPAREELDVPQPEKTPRPPAPVPKPSARTGFIAAARTVHRTEDDWSVKDALGTVQFYVLISAYFANILCLVTVTSLSVGHLIERGVSPTIAGAMLSLEGLVAVLARACTGFLGDHVDPRMLMIFSLGATVLGCIMLAQYQAQPFLLIYAVGTGIGFGATQLCATVLMLNYYGQRNNLELFSTMCLVGAGSALGPLLGGAIRDLTGSFVPVFLVLAVVTGAVWVGVVMMRPPQRDAVKRQARSATDGAEDQIDDLMTKKPV